ncbi:MAG: 16S rRNA (uracil(1498)-N(3))-methyltransferase, partial [Candidatus Eremiobacteraeota bacterium]|nr:16S rRNA (uracil(1498)-N(3))-methyltransferase [Candidatus Eremiobacteraeota bacterium]
MSARRFFVEGTRACSDAVTFEGSDAHKIARVLRLRSGDIIEVIDSTGTAFSAAIESITPQVVAVLNGVLASDTLQSSMRVSIAQGIPKSAKMDFVVEKLVELGAAAILPFESERSVVTGSGSSKIERWRRLAKSAAQQCGRTDVPAISDPVPIAELIARFAHYDRVLFAWELSAQVAMHDALPNALASAQNVLAVIGPEGGFSHAEAQAACDAGAVLISLGRRILRTETAGMALLSVIQYLAEGGL